MQEYVERAGLLGKAGKFLAEENAVAVIVPSRDGRDGGGSGGTSSTITERLCRRPYLKRDRVNPLPVAVAAIENYGRLYRLTQIQCAGQRRDQHRH